MGEFPEPHPKSAAGVENRDIGRVRRGPKTLPIKVPFQICKIEMCKHSDLKDRSTTDIV